MSAGEQYAAAVGRNGDWSEVAGKDVRPGSCIRPEIIGDERDQVRI